MLVCFYKPIWLLKDMVQYDMEVIFPEKVKANF